MNFLGIINSIATVEVLVVCLGFIVGIGAYFVRSLNYKIDILICDQKELRKEVRADTDNMRKDMDNVRQDVNKVMNKVYELHSQVLDKVYGLHERVARLETIQDLQSKS